MGLLRRLLALLGLVLVLVSCSADGGADSGAEGGGQEQADGDAGGDDGGFGVGDVDEEADRQVVTTGSMTLVVRDTADAADEVVRIVESAGGRVDERAEHAGDEWSEPSAWLVVRVPSADLTAVLDRLAGLGEQRDLSLASVDVTRTTRDLDARIEALEASVDRLVGLLGEAQTTEALIAAESSLSDRQSQLESLRSERAYLAEQVAMSTIRLDLVARSSPSIEPGGFLGGLRTGWDALVSFVGSLLVALGVLLPWLALFGVLAAAAVPLWRRRRRNRPARPAAAPHRTGFEQPVGPRPAGAQQQPGPQQPGPQQPGPPQPGPQQPGSQPPAPPQQRGPVSGA